MDDIKKVFQSEFREMESSFLRKAFRLHAFDYLERLYTKIEERFNFIKKRSYHSIEFRTHPIVYQGIVDLEEYDICSTDMFPYFADDLQKKTKLELFNCGETELSRGVLYLSKNELEVVLSKKYRGYIVENDNKHYFTYMFQFDDRYYNEEEKLKHVYKANNLKWSPLYSPYTHKMFKIIIIENEDCKAYVGKAEKLDLGDIPFEYKQDVIPIWNIRRDTVLSTSDATYKPEGYYEYRIDAGGENKILVNLPGIEIIDMKKDKMGDLVVSTYSPHISSWDLLILNKSHDKLKLYKNFKYRIFNNRELESFTGKLKNKYGNRVRSEAEIHRLCNSYEQLQDLEVKKFTSNDDYVDIELRFYNDGSIENETMVKFFIEILNLEFWETRFNIKY